MLTSYSQQKSHSRPGDNLFCFFSGTISDYYSLYSIEPLPNIHQTVSCSYTTASPTCHSFRHLHSIDIELSISLCLTYSHVASSPALRRLLALFSPPILPPSPHYCTNMLLSSLSSLNAPPNPTHGSLLPSVPSNPLFVVL